MASSVIFLLITSRSLWEPASGAKVRVEERTEEIAENAWSHWYRNGGQVTFEQWSQQSKEDQDRIIKSLHSLPAEIDLQINGQAYKLAHAAPPELYDGDPKYRHATYFSIWKRYTPEDILPIDYTLIFGHTPTRYYRDIAPMEIWHHRGHIGIDCGCAYPSPEGRLACLRLEDGKVFYSLEESGKPL